MPSASPGIAASKTALWTGRVLSATIVLLLILAILLTGYLGGAVMAHHRVFPTYLGALLWLSLYLRDPRLRVLVPFRS